MERRCCFGGLLADTAGIRAVHYLGGALLVADCERVLGNTHPDTLTARNNLAAAYQDAGRQDEAEDLQNRAEPRS